MHATLTPGQPVADDVTFCWLAPTGDVLVADSRTGLVAEMLPGYPDDEADALVVRHQALCRAAAVRQAAAIGDRPGHDPASLSEAQLTAMLGAKSATVDARGPWPADAPDLWLVATGYAPYTSTPAPTGEGVHLLDPFSETTFLDALELLGAGELMVRGDGDD